LALRRARRKTRNGGFDRRSQVSGFASYPRLVGYRVLHAEDAFWRPSNQMGVMNTDLAKQLEVDVLGARLWRLTPGQANTKHRHPEQWELYVLLEGQGRIRAGDDVLTLAPLSAVVIEPHTVRQLFNDTDTDQLWLIFGAPREQLTSDDVAWMYPDGPKAPPPELA
jgi:quercetin dioxygenase-like cupin family protein